MLTRPTTPTISWKLCSSHHGLGIVGALSKSSPSLTIVILICTIPTSSHDLIKWIYMDPLCCWPLFAFNYWASCTKTFWVWNSIWVKTEEKKCIPSLRFYCIIILPNWTRKIINKHNKPLKMRQRIKATMFYNSLTCNALFCTLW